MSEEMKAWVAWNPGAKINVRLVHGWEEEMWAYQLNLSGEHHPTTIVAMELPLASRTPSANREVVEAALRNAYIAGATDVHVYWRAGGSDTEPDFAEAAHDYAQAALAAIEE